MNKSSVAKSVLAMAVVALLAGGGVYLWMQRTADDGELLRLYGNVDIREVQLAFRQPGRVADMAFDEGDPVTAGMRMATLDSRPYQDALAAAEASVEVARAELAKLRRRRPRAFAAKTLPPPKRAWLPRKRRVRRRKRRSPTPSCWRRATARSSRGCGNREAWSPPTAQSTA